MATDDEIAAFAAVFGAAEREVGRVVLGQEAAVRAALVALFARGHVLLEGPPGTAKTLLVRRARAGRSAATFKRIQFTPDLMPSDITGGSIFTTPERRLQLPPGPDLRATSCSADEINRAPAKTQAALLEAMQERQVTVDGDVPRAARGRSSCSRRRTRSSSKAPTRCPRRSSTASW